MGANAANALAFTLARQHYPLMAFIPYVPPDDIPPSDRVPDDDHILRVGVRRDQRREPKRHADERDRTSEHAPS